FPSKFAHLSSLLAPHLPLYSVTVSKTKCHITLGPHVAHTERASAMPSCGSSGQLAVKPRSVGVGGGRWGPLAIHSMVLHVPRSVPVGASIGGAATCRPGGAATWGVSPPHGNSAGA